MYPTGELTSKTKPTSRTTTMSPVTQTLPSPQLRTSSLTSLATRALTTLTFGPSDGHGSQDFLDLEVELPGDENASARGSSIHEQSEDSMSIGIGRDAPPRRTARQSMASNLLGGQDIEMSGYSRAASNDDDFGDDGENLVQLDFGGVDMDFAQAPIPPLVEPPVADMAQPPEQTRSRSSKP